MLLAMRSSRPRFDPDAVTVWSSFSTPPSDSDKTNINNLVVALKEAGIWSELDVLYVLAAANSNAAVKNWKAPGTFSLSLVNSPTFTAYRGFTGDGASAYLNTGWTPSTHGVKFTQNDASVWAWPINNIASNSSIAGSVSSHYCFLYPRTVGGAAAIYLNSAAGGASVSSVGDARGFIGGQRRGASDVRLFKNGVQIATNNQASTGVPTASMWVLGAYPSSYSSFQNSFSAWGSSLSGKEAAFDAAVRTYLTAVGAI
jgi:hypothetical protein